MRRLALRCLGAGVFLSFSALPALASNESPAPPPPDINARELQDELILEGEQGPADPNPNPNAPARPAQPVGGGGGGTPPPPPEDIVYEPSWGTHPETDEPCIELTRIEREGVAHSGLATEYEHRTLTMLGDERLRGVEHLFCGDVEGEDNPDSPRAVAQAFVRSIGVPVPEPRIDPGWAMTGMPAYLEIHGQEGFTHTEEIAGFGQLRVSFEPTHFEIDWGDGTIKVVDDGRTGAPYNGDQSQQISHTYVDVDEGTVVRVEARWLATWELAGFNGVVGGLQTSEEFPLEVREMQSVRTSGG